MQTDSPFSDSPFSDSPFSDPPASKPPATDSLADASPKTSSRALAAFILGLFSLGCTCVTGIPAVLVGLLALWDIKRSPQHMRGGILAILGILMGLGTSVLATVGIAIVGVQASRHAAVTADLKEIGLAMHIYHDTYRVFPWSGVEYSPPKGEGEQQATLHLSWRVRLLRHFGDPESQQLYEQFDFHSPWDSPHNRALIERMPKIYATPGELPSSGMTRYQGVVYPRSGILTSDQKLIRDYGRGTVFDRTFPSEQRLIRPPRAAAIGMASIVDGTSNTVMIVEADDPVIWTKPDDWEFHVEAPGRGLGKQRFGGFFVVMTDGRVTFLPAITDDEILRRLFCISDGHPIDLPR